MSKLLKELEIFFFSLDIFFLLYLTLEKIRVFLVISSYYLPVHWILGGKLILTFFLFLAIKTAWSS